MTRTEEALNDELRSLFALPTHDSWEAAAIILYAVNGKEPTADEIQAKIDSVEWGEQ